MIYDRLPSPKQMQTLLQGVAAVVEVAVAITVCVTTMDEARKREAVIVCNICGLTAPETREKRLYVDHDHATDVIRGWLCYRCNNLLFRYELYTGRYIPEALRFLRFKTPEMKSCKVVRVDSQYWRRRLKRSVWWAELGPWIKQHLSTIQSHLASDTGFKWDQRRKFRRQIIS